MKRHGTLLYDISTINPNRRRTQDTRKPCIATQYDQSTTSLTQYDQSTTSLTQYDQSTTSLIVRGNNNVASGSDLSMLFKLKRAHSCLRHLFFGKRIRNLRSHPLNAHHKHWICSTMDSDPHTFQAKAEQPFC